jgi:hypothetical protein
MIRRMIGAGRCHIDSLRELVGLLKSEQASCFQVELERACNAVDRALRPLPDGFSVGPLALIVETEKLSARLVYAKTDA